MAKLLLVEDDPALQFTIATALEAKGYEVDAAATIELRATLRAGTAVPPPMIDRGAGYEQMAQGECAQRMRGENT